MPYLLFLKKQQNLLKIIGGALFNVKSTLTLPLLSLTMIAAVRPFTFTKSMSLNLIGKSCANFMCSFIGQGQGLH